LEGNEYRYELVVGRGASDPLETDHPEVFVPDRVDGQSGRLRPGLYTGLMSVRILVRGVAWGRFSIEVRSRKLAYLSDYRWMLRDIAQSASELVMERFAASQQRFAPDTAHDPSTLYQRFAFLNSILADEGFDAAMQRILARPHVTWDQEEHVRRPGQGWSGGGQAARQLARAGRRVPAPAGPLSLLGAGVPEWLVVQRTEPSLDNTPNRFVKFALERWHEVVSLVGQRLAAIEGAAGARATRDVVALRNRLESVLAEELFREVGDLAHFPSDDQVLQKKEGYRDIFRAFVLFDVAARLAWSGGEDVYGAGQKDVATLYEYWAFLQLAQTVASVCDSPFDSSALLSVTGDGMSVDLRRGRATMLNGRVHRLGRTLELELWFNRTFGSRSGGDAASWTRPMRPDCSLFIKPEGIDQLLVEPVWLHFDAKYRVDSLLEIMVLPASSDDEERRVVEEHDAAERRGQAKREDLLKMHAYRDAIRRSAGAYVLYPGSERDVRTEFHELLPGLGAFALRPSATGDALGAGPLREFVSDVLDHVALQLSQHERGRYWIREVYQEEPSAEPSVPQASFLTRPAADTVVLLGYAKSETHYRWIQSHGLYNLRADDRTGAVGLGSRELAAALLILHGATGRQPEVWQVAGDPQLLTSEQLVRTGYPSPRGNLYYCLAIRGPLSGDWRSWLTQERIAMVRETCAPGAAFGAPVSTTWLDLFRRQ
jgi:predicted component of viral defense system (DUF524 family)